MRMVDESIVGLLSLLLVSASSGQSIQSQEWSAWVTTMSMWHRTPF